MKNKAEQKRKRKRCSTNFYFESYFEKTVKTTATLIIQITSRY